MPYRSRGNQRNNVQLGVGRSIWTGSPPPAIPEQVLDGIPGFLAWLSLLLVVAGAVLRPSLVITVSALVAFYSAARFVLAAGANWLGLRRIRRWEAVDWRAEYARLAGPDSLPREAVHHVVIIPNYKEPFEVLSQTLEVLACQEIAARQMTIVLAMEAADPTAQPTAEKLRTLFRDRFANFYFTIHPKGLPGEMQGKSANEAWAARWIKRKLVDQKGYDIDRILVTTMDADTIWHPDHFACLTTLFATHPDRYQRFWQAPIRYHGNIWDIHPAMALIHAYSSAWELAHLAMPWWRPMPISSYSLSMRLLDGVGYWDADVMAEDWHMYIKAFFQRDGEVLIEPVFLPWSGNAVVGEGLWGTIKSRYDQTLRHAWGTKEVGYTVARIIERKHMRFLTGLRLLVRVAHEPILSGAGWIIMTVGPQLAFVLYPELLTDWTTPSMILLQISLALVTIFGIVFWAQDMRLRPPRPRRWTARERFMTLLSFPLLPVLSLIFLALPVLHAQTLLMLGISIQYKVAKKI